MRCCPDFPLWRSAALVCAFLLVLSPSSAYVRASDVVELDPRASRVSLNDALRLFVDPTGRLDIDDVARPEMASRFELPPGVRPVVLDGEELAEVVGHLGRFRIQAGTLLELEHSRI